MTDAALRTWADAHLPAGSALAAGVLRLLGERDAAVTNRDDLRALCLAFAARICAQSELLGKRAEKAE